MKYQHTQKWYAKREKCDARTIRNWIAQNAPLDDPEKLSAWKASRKNLPPQARDAIELERGPLPSPAADGQLNTGAASALRRLEDEEVNAYKALRVALSKEKQNPYEIKLLREAWLKTGDSLRRYDLLVEQSRRDSGDLFPRAEVERILRALAWYIRISGQQNAQSTAAQFCGITEAWEANKLLSRLLSEQLLNTFSALASHSDGELSIPGWIIKALCSDLEHVLKDVPSLTEQRAQTFRQLIEFNGRKLITKQKASHRAQKA